MGASQPSAADDAYQISKSLRFNDGDTPYLNRTLEKVIQGFGLGVVGLKEVVMVHIKNSSLQEVLALITLISSLKMVQ